MADAPHRRPTDEPPDRVHPLAWFAGGVIVATAALLVGQAWSPPAGSNAAPPDGPAPASPAASANPGAARVAPGAEAAPFRPTGNALADRLAARQRAWLRVERELEDLDRQSEGDVELSLGVLQDFFTQRKAGARPFAATVLSLRGKWEFIHSRLPYADENEHRRFLRERFEQQVFAPDELRQAVEAAVADALARHRERENALLVRLRADLADLPDGAIPALAGDASFRDAYAALAREVEAAIAGGVEVATGREAASLIGGEIAATVALRALAAAGAKLGVSGAVLSGGAASAWASFGVGLVAAIVVDLGIDWTIRQAGHDPEGQIAAQVGETLDHVESLLIEGDREALDVYRKLRQMARADPSEAVRARAAAAAERIEAGGRMHGLRAELTRLAQERSTVRREALRQLIFEGDEP